MIKRIYLLLFLVLPFSLPAQSGPWEKWDPELIASLHTARDTEYMNEEEKKVVLFMNMARHDGTLFAETFLFTYLEEHPQKTNNYIRSLQRDLKKTAGLGPLLPAMDLTAVAQGHAKRTGEKGSTGHSGFKKRFEPLMGNPYRHVGENCSYGYQHAVDIVISLLIDEGVKDLGHRKNILAPDFNSIGVAIRPHRSYRVNCVMDFGSSDRSGMNSVPY